MPLDRRQAFGKHRVHNGRKKIHWKWTGAGGPTRRQTLRILATHATSLRSITVLCALAKGNHSASRRRENGGANEINSMHEDQCSLSGDFHQPVPALSESPWRLLGDRFDAARAGRVVIMFRRLLWQPGSSVVPVWLFVYGLLIGVKMALMFFVCRKLFA